MKKDNPDKKQNITDVSEKKIKFKKTLKIILTVFLLLILVGSGTAIALVFSIINDAPSFDPKYLRPPETSYIYDNKGNEVAKLHQDQNRTVIPLQEIPDHVKNAFIAIEDERFEDHFGIDLMGIIRASLVNLRSQGIVQGASTITQQLMRNAFLTQKQTYERKIQEAWLAVQIEREYTKDEILEMYLNLIYFGNGVYGIEAASETYFNKNTGDLTIAEGAMLAGTVNSPNYNNPIYSEERAINRMHIVINKMKDLGYISSSEAKEARETEEFEFGEIRSPEYPFPYFVDYVLHDELVGILADMPEYGSKENAYTAIYNEGLRIITTLDAELQEVVEYTLNRADKYPTTLRIDMNKFREAYTEAGHKIPADFPNAFIDEENGIPQPQSAIVLANPSTGEIHALGGGREYRKQGNEVLRFKSRRQPGSSIKPIVSYAPAFEEGLMSPGSIVYDVPLTVGSYSPRSWDGEYWGPITVREAIKWSRNIPAVSVLQQVTPGKGTEYAEKMGITSFSDDDRGSLSTALGGVSGISVFDMAQAFGTIANQGVKKPFYTVERIEDRSGNILFQQESIPEVVLSQQTSYMITDILEETHRTTFTSNRLYIDRPVAVKTGTTNDNRDTFLAAYTPNLVSFFWMGYDFPEMGRIYGGHGLTTSITRDIFVKALDGLEVISFESFRPGGIIRMEVCTESGMKPTDLCHDAGSTKNELFTAGTAPKNTCDKHVLVEICKDSGLLPSQYCPSKSIVEEVFFIGRHSVNEPPEETCDVHTKDDRPGRPASLSAEWNPQSRNITLSWSAPARNKDIKEYRIYRESAQEEHSFLATSKNTRHVDSKNIQEDMQYTYTIYAVNKDGILSKSVTTMVSTPAESPPEPQPPQTPPESPSLYSPANGHSGASVTPTLFWNTSDGATSYTTEISLNEAFSEIVYSITVSRTVITVGQELDSGTNYWWRVRAENSAGTSSWSDLRSFTTESPAEPLTGLNIIRSFFMFSSIFKIGW